MKQAMHVLLKLKDVTHDLHGGKKISKLKETQRSSCCHTHPRTHACMFSTDTVSPVPVDKVPTVPVCACQYDVSLSYDPTNSGDVSLYSEYYRDDLSMTMEVPSEQLSAFQSSGSVALVIDAIMKCNAWNQYFLR